MKQQNFYQSRINLAINYINNHLAEEIKIETLAKVSHFSTFHFQRLYKGLMQETPYETLHRLRLEKAVHSRKI